MIRPARRLVEPLSTSYPQPVYRPIVSPGRATVLPPLPDPALMRVHLIERLTSLSGFARQRLPDPLTLTCNRAR